MECKLYEVEFERVADGYERREICVGTAYFVGLDGACSNAYVETFDEASGMTTAVYIDKKRGRATRATFRRSF